MKINTQNFIGSLYKMYKDESYNFSSIFNEQLFLSLPTKFNDPFDCFIGINKDEFERAYLDKNNLQYIDEKSIKEIDKNLDYFEKLANGEHPVKTESAEDKNKKLRLIINEAYKKYLDEIKKIYNEYYIASFTLNKPEHNMTMWSWYANEYKGFCVKFSFEKLFYDYGSERIDKYQEFLYKKIKKVKYTDTCLKIDCKKLINIPLESIHSNSYINGLIRKAAIQKNKQWNYENEYRLILHKNDLEQLNKIIPNSVLFLKFGCLINFPYSNALFFSDKHFSDATKKSLSDIAGKLKIYKNHLSLSESNKILFVNETSFDIENLSLKIENVLSITNTVPKFVDENLLPF